MSYPSNWRQSRAASRSGPSALGLGGGAAAATALYMGDTPTAASIAGGAAIGVAADHMLPDLGKIPFQQFARGAWRAAAAGLGRTVGIAIPAVTAGVGLWASYKLQGALERILPPPGYRLCRVCQPPIPIPNQGFRIGHYSASEPICSTGVGAACLTSQASTPLENQTPDTHTGIGGLRRYRVMGIRFLSAGQPRYHWLMVWGRGAPARVRGPVAAPWPNRAWAVPGFLVPADQAGDTQLRMAPPVPIPWRLIPAARALPGSFQTRSGSYGGPDLSPPLIPGLSIGWGATGNPVVVRPITREVPRAVAAPSVKEVKQRVPRPILAAWQAMGWLSEFNDFIEVLYKALPRHIQKTYPNTAAGRVQAIAENAGEIDVAAAIVWFFLNEAQDQAYGRAFGRAGLAARGSGNADLWRAWSTGV